MEPLGRWVPVELVCETGMSRVFRARANRGRVCRERETNSASCREFAGYHENDDRPAGYALKVLRECREKDPGAVAVMCREVEAARSVRHPRVISVLAAGLHGPPYYVVTPWLQGRTLAARLAEPVGLDLPVVLWIVRQVAEALEGMLAAGWTHGDIKPDNVFLSPQGHVTLLDLGFASKVDCASVDRASVDRANVDRAGGECRFGKAASIDWRYFTGTGSYLAPEAATMSVDVRSDIYSLGVMFFEMLSGRLPFKGDDLATLIVQHRESAIPSPRRFAPHIPVEVIHLVRQMLSKQPLRRPHSPRELIGRLAELEIRSFGERTLDGGFAV